MRLVMLGKKNRTIGRQLWQFVANGFSQIELLTEPGGQDRRKGAPAPGSDGEIRFQDASELKDGFVIEGNRIEFGRLQARLSEAEFNRVAGKIGVVLFARETLLLRSREDFAVVQHRGRGIMIKSGD